MTRHPVPENRGHSENLGTPDAPAPSLAYLAQFLSDQRVIDHRLWQPLLRGIILNTRKSAAPTPKSGTTSVATARAPILGDVVEAMSPHRPRGRARDFPPACATAPQHRRAAGTAGSGLPANRDGGDLSTTPARPRQRATRALPSCRRPTGSHRAILRSPAYIHALAQPGRTPSRNAGLDPGRDTTSYHGEGTYLTGKGDPYHRCKTTRLLGEALPAITASHLPVLRPGKMAQPYTTKTSMRWARGLKIACRGFSADCLGSSATSRGLHRGGTRLYPVKACAPRYAASELSLVPAARGRGNAHICGMNARGSFLTLFLFRRELSILSLFLMQGGGGVFLLLRPLRAGPYFVAMRLMVWAESRASPCSAGALATEILLYQNPDLAFPTDLTRVRRVRDHRRLAGTNGRRRSAGAEPDPQPAADPAEPTHLAQPDPAPGYAGGAMVLFTGLMLIGPVGVGAASGAVVFLGVTLPGRRVWTARWSGPTSNSTGPWSTRWPAGATSAPVQYPRLLLTPTLLIGPAALLSRP